MRQLRTGTVAGISGFFEKDESLVTGLAAVRGLREQAAEEGADAGDDGVAGLRIFLLRLLVLGRGRSERFCERSAE